MSAMDLQTSHLAAALMSGAAFNANSDNAPIIEETEKPPEVQKDPSDEDKEDASGEEFTDEESEAQTGSKSMPGRGVTLPMLLEDKMLEPGIAAMTIEYLGQKFVGDLQTDGKIKSHETETIFCSPSAWAIHCKRIINPDKRSGCGWASVKYRGKKLDTIKATYLRKKQLQRENMHSDEETEMEVESPPEPPPQRVVMKHNTVPNRMMQHDANMLIESISFTSAGKVQPFMVSVSSNASLVLDIHCHLKKEEVYGYLAGTWDLNNHNVMITHTFPCLVSKNDKKPRVMVEIEIQMEIEKLGLVLLGWYHSHPTNPAMPSLRDCDNQLEYQIKMRGPTEVSYVPCVGVICSPYNPESPELESSLTFFWVMPPPEQRPTEYPRPLYLQHNIVHDTHLSPHAMEQIRKTIKYYFSFPDDTFINFKDSYKPDISYLDKLKCTLTGKFPREQSDGLLWHFIREELGCSSENDDKMDLDALLAVPQPIPVSKPTPPAPVPTFPSVSTLQQMVSRPAGVPPINVSSSIGSGSPHKFETPQLNIPVLPSSSKSSSKSTTPTLPPSYPTGLDMLTSMALGLGSANMSMPLGASSLESLAAANSMLNSLAPGLTASLTGGKLPDPPSYAASLQNLTSSLGSFDKTSSNTSTTSSTPIPASIASNLMMSSADIANALFSATKYSNAGILGIPDPMSKSTLAANNMFLSPSLIKMQESLMKPLSTSSPISSKAGLDQSALMKSPHELMKSNKDYSKDYVKDMKKEFSKEHAKDFSKDYSKDYGKDFSREQSKNYRKEYGKDFSREQSKDYGIDYSREQGKDYSKSYEKDFSREQSKDFGKNLSREQSKDYIKDYGKDLTMEQSKAYIKDYGKDLTMEQSKAYNKDYGKDFSREQSKDYGKDFSMEQNKDYGKDFSMEQSKDYGKDYGKNFSIEQSKNYSKDFSMEQCKDYSKDYGKDFSKEYGKDFGKDYGNDTGKDYTKESSRDFSQDYTKDINKDYNKDYVADYSKNYSKDYGKDFGKDYTKESKEQNKDYGKDYTKEYGKDFTKDYMPKEYGKDYTKEYGKDYTKEYGKDYTKEYANRDYNKEFKDYAKEYKDYLPPDFGSVAKGKPDIPLAEAMQVPDHSITAKSDVSKPEPMDTQATDFSMPPRVGGESFLNQMLELTKKTTMPDYMGDYNPPSKISKIEELVAPLAPLPPTIHPYLDSSDVVDPMPLVGMSAMGTFVKPDQPLDCGKEQDYSPQPKPSESDK